MLNTEATYAELLSHYDGILRYVYSKVQDAALAQDLTQDTYYKAIRSIHTLKPDSSPYAWLYRIATNRLYDHYRHMSTYWQHFYSVPIDDEDTQEPIDEGNSPEEIVEGREQLEHILALVERLPGQQAETMQRWIVYEFPMLSTALPAQDAYHPVKDKMRLYRAKESFMRLYSQEQEMLACS